MVDEYSSKMVDEYSSKMAYEHSSKMVYEHSSKMVYEHSSKMVYEYSFNGFNTRFNLYSSPTRVHSFTLSVSSLFVIQMLATYIIGLVNHWYE
jgi:hypothetical protein